ncbi:MAG: serine/threonine protein kinase [Planctomycetota bacterium]|nr:MAG: serine/threonine protein kinase [Planctomycetota bacterium]
MIGQRLGDFVVDRELGEGGVGRVYLGHRAGSEERVAIKVLHPELAGEELFLKRFRREAQAARALPHPHVVTLLGSGTSRGVHWIAYEYVEGGTLAELLEREGPLAEERALSVARDLADALRCAAERGLIHRDLKPENVLLDAEGRPKLADLGLVKLNDPALTRLTRPGAVVGTPHYMAPEQARGEEIDWRADQYALGLCLWTMLTCELPFDPSGSAPVVSVVRARLEGDLPDVRRRRPELRAETATVLGVLTARRPEARYPTPEAVVENLERACLGRPVRGGGASPSSPPGGETTDASTPSPPPRSRRGAWFLAAAAAALLALALAAATRVLGG